MLYNAPLDQPTNPNAPYVDGNPQAGIQGSIVPAASIEFDQREIVEVITRANVRGYFDFSGMACGLPTNADLTQLRKAIEGFITNVEYFIDTHVTYTVHGPGAKFTDLNAAMTWLSKYKILRNGFVTLQLAGATSGVAQQFVYTTDIILEHPNSDKIAIQGMPLIAAPPNEGSFQVTVVGYSLADANAQVAMLRATLGTEIHLVNGCACIVYGDFQIGNLLFTGDGSAIPSWGSLLLLAGGGVPYLSNVAAHGTGGSAGIMVNQSYLVCGGSWVSASGCTGTWGFEIQGDVLVSSTNGFISASNSGIGIAPQTGTSIKYGSVFCKGNGSHGFSSQYANHTIYSSRFYNNGGQGIYAAGSNISCANPYFANNGSGYAIYAQQGSYMYIGGKNIASGAVSPPLNTVGNGNSLVEG